MKERMVSKTMKEMEDELKDVDIDEQPTRWTHEEMASKMNMIHNIDCLEFIRKVPDGYFDLVLTDIPYNEVNRESAGLRELDKSIADISEFNLSELAWNIGRISKGSVIMFCGMKQLSEITKSLQEDGFSTRTIIWEKTNPSPMNAQYLFVSGVELAAYGKKSGAYYDGEYCNTVFKYKSGESKIHPTQKPIKLWERLLEKVAEKNAKVFDPFMGSGTTAVACESLGLQWCGCELEPDYVEIANKRLKAVQMSIFSLDGAK